VGNPVTELVNTPDRRELLSMLAAAVAALPRDLAPASR